MDTPTTREPCPDRMVDGVGGAFAMGAVGASVFHFIKGSYNSPNWERLAGGFHAVRMNAPRVGGSFAVCGGVYSVVKCAMVHVRQKEDPWNNIAAAAGCRVVLNMRHGVAVAGRSALLGACLISLVEGAYIRHARAIAAPQILPPVPADDPNLAAYSGEGSFFWGLFGTKEKEKQAGGESEILESFHTPCPPIPSFYYK